MFEEIAIWKRVDPKIAIRYVGFRNLETSRVWIAYGNYIGLDPDKDLVADDMVVAQATLEYFLNAFPSDAELWKPTISEALATFIANNPDT
jgi:hypothetical protein